MFAGNLMIRKIPLFLFIIFALLLILRIVAPTFLLNYVLKTLNKIPEYRTQISDINLQLLQGGYEIKNIKVSKIKQNIPVPYFSSDSIYIVLQWDAILHGRLVGQIILQHPQLNFVIEQQKNKQQLTINGSWQNRVKELYPFRFNKVTINNGEIHLRSFTALKPFNIYLKNVQAVATNISNIIQKNAQLPATIISKGNTMDGGTFNLTMSFDPLAKQPTFDMDAELKRMNIIAANSLLKSFTNIEVKQGYFSLYLEAAAAKGKITGYAKPLLENLQITDPNEKLPPPQKLYKTIVAGVAKILENRETKAVATKVTIAGNINNPDMSMWTLVINLLRNAFLQALLPRIDKTIEFNSINVNQQFNLYKKGANQ